MMQGWIFLSKQGNDKYINMLARSAGAEPYNSDYFDYEYDVAKDGNKLVLRGILKHKIMQQCWRDQRDFFYMDSGYLGNHKSELNPMGNKNWHRIVRNNIQHGDVIARPADRWEALGMVMKPRRQGRRILVAAPDDKPCKFYGIDREQWILETTQTLQQHTDRPIVVRNRARRRSDRVLSDPLHRVLADDVHALVTFNSNAAVEAVTEGVPVFVSAPSHAAAPVGNRDLSQIETPFWPSDDQRYQWLCHLAYCQYSVRELKNGTAFRMMNET
jgi:hypothetical protein